MKLHLALMAAVSLSDPAWAQDIPAPYGAPEHQWAAPPDSEAGKWGSSAGIERGPHGEIWAIDRCGANSCDGSDKNPIVLLDPATGKAIRAIGAGLFVFPHGLHVDAHGNIWVTDGGISRDGSKGLQVLKLSPAGKVLLRIGTAGQRGLDETHFQSPSDVITAPNGDVFVTDGHAPIPNTVPAGLEMRVMKFDHNGKFIAQWGKLGSKAGEFNNPHALGLDNKGRLYVADRANNRIQIFDESGKFLDQWPNIRMPSKVMVTADQAVWVSSAAYSRMAKFDTNGKLQTYWGTFGDAPGSADNLHAFAVDEAGNYYIADTWNNRVLKFAPRADADKTRLMAPEFKFK